MSVKPPKAEVARRRRHFRFVPKADIRTHFEYQARSARNGGISTTYSAVRNGVVIALTPSLARADMVLTVSLRLFAVIAGATVTGFTLHAAIGSVRPLGAGFYTAIDGSSAILLGVVVIGLMSAAGVVLDTDIRSFGWTLAAACIANFSLQLAAWFVLKYLRARAGLQDGVCVRYEIIAGNRNVALFLTALPATQTELLLLFIGCYQLPMSDLAAVREVIQTTKSFRLKGRMLVSGKRYV